MYENFYHHYTCIDINKKYIGNQNEKKKKKKDHACQHTKTLKPMTLTNEIAKEAPARSNS
jgi:hypothetical protein